jgi:hypothetical protein
MAKQFPKEIYWIQMDKPGSAASVEAGLDAGGRRSDHGLVCVDLVSGNRPRTWNRLNCSLLTLISCPVLGRH